VEKERQNEEQTTPSYIALHLPLNITRPKHITDSRMVLEFHIVLSSPKKEHQQVADGCNGVPEHQAINAHNCTDWGEDDVDGVEDDVDEGEEEADDEEGLGCAEHGTSHHVGCRISCVPQSCSKPWLPSLLTFKAWFAIDVVRGRGVGGTG